MTRVTYPTGGNLSISYENDEFTISNETYKLGSARIKKLSQVFNDGTTLEKNYSYKLDNGKSSGQIAFFDVNKPKISLAINNTAYVLYSKVEEAITGNGEIINEYSNFNEYPDLLEQFNFNDCDPGLYNSPPCSIIVKPANIKVLKETKFPYINVMSQSHRRGLLTQKTIKNTLGETINREIYKYKNYVKDSLLVGKFITDYKPERASCNFTSVIYTLKSKNYIRAENSFLTKVIKESYLLNGMVAEESNYTYNEPYNLMTTKQNIVSNGKVTETKYQYPVDLNQTWLTSKNVLGIPLITTQTFKNNITDQGKLLSKTETVYPTSSGSIAGEFALPLSSKSYNLDNSQQTDIVYDKYDSKGNLLQYTTKEGIPVTIIWGYNNTEPIAKIEGAIYNNIKDNAKVISIINASDDDALNPNNEGTLINSLDNLRTDDAFKDYQTTTYSYDPLKGITSVTSPSGIRQVYIYDTAGRLKEIREAIKTGNLLKEFNYNYAPTTHYNSEKSGNFTKYCGGSGIGSSFTYIVAPNTYSSIISQADADQKAQNDVNANGQNAANNNPSGTCTPFTCNLSFNTSIGISGGGSVSVQSNGYYKASFGFSSGSNSTNLPWMTTGVKVATISGSCLPTTEYSSYNGQVYYTIKTNGDVILRSQSTAPGNNTSYSYDIIFPIN